MRIKKETLRGYILEEVVARLIRNAGYRLLVNPNQDLDSLSWERHGLVVHGRGAKHQADVLGQLSWIPAFTYPLRLSVEAKFRSQRTGLPILRDAVGKLLDVNQYNIPRAIQAGVPLHQKYQYVSAIFSTSGFTEPAVDMAFAHGISLIDLGTPNFDAVRQAVDASANSLVERFSGPEPDEETRRGDFIRNLRYALRQGLHTTTGELLEQNGELQAAITESIEQTLTATNQANELFVGMANGPFMLALQPDNPDDFLEYARENPTHAIHISWSRADNDGRTWRLWPLNQPDVYRLSFNLPETLSEWIFSAENVTQAALNVKEQFFSDIMIYRKDPDRDLLIRLQFDKQNIAHN